MKKIRQNNEPLHEEIRKRSDYIKQIHDFAKYMEKEYELESTDDRSLLICAADKTLGDGEVGAAHIMLGDIDLTTASVSSMMEQEKMGIIFRMARIMAEVTHDDLGDLVFVRHRHLRRLYWSAAGVAAWTLCVVALQVVGIANWITTVSNLILMAWVNWLVWREIGNVKYDIYRLDKTRNEEFRERKKMQREKVFDVLRQVSDDDDDE